MNKTLTAILGLAFCMIAVGNVLADEARNERIIERHINVWHNQDWTIADEILADNYIRHALGGGVLRGPEAYKENIKNFMTTFPDTRWSFDIVISQGDYVMVHYTGTGTHTGPGIGTPTGKKWKWPVVVIHRLAGGKMRECWVLGDNLDFMQQLGYRDQKVKHPRP